MAEQDLTDDYVAKLLKEDAAKVSRNYAMGLGGLLPKRPTANAPKPNTRFLRTILRETDSHNQALLAKEAEEARARLRALRNHGANQDRLRRDVQNIDRDQSHRMQREDDHRSKRQRVDILAADRNRLSPPRESKRHRSDDSPERNAGRIKKRRVDDFSDGEYDRKSHRSSKRHRRRREDYSDEEADQSYRKDERVHYKSRRRRSRSQSSDNGVQDDSSKARLPKAHHKSRRHQDMSVSRSRSRDRFRDVDESHRKRRKRGYSSRPGSRSRSRTHSPRERRSTRPDHGHSVVSEASTSLKPEKRPRELAQPLYRPPKRGGTTQKKTSDPESDSDPLEDLVGPLPPRQLPKVKIRGRGAFSASAMDTHFSSAYDPSADVALDPEEDGDWEQALEALRDRQKYKQQHGDRLRAAGFTEEEVKKWEKGGEKGEEDVRWAKKGEGREWDRGKVVGSDGHVDVKAEWGRLKDT